MLAALNGLYWNAGRPKLCMRLQTPSSCHRSLRELDMKLYGFHMRLNLAAPVSYSSIEMSLNKPYIVPWGDSPNVDSHWARAVSISESEVRFLFLGIWTRLLIHLAHLDHNVKNWWFVCEQASPGEELHIFPRDKFFTAQESEQLHPLTHVSRAN